MIPQTPLETARDELINAIARENDEDTPHCVIDYDETRKRFSTILSTLIAQSKLEGAIQTLKDLLDEGGMPVEILKERIKTLEKVKENAL